MVGMKRLVLALVAALLLVGCGKQNGADSQSAISAEPLTLSTLQKKWSGDQGICEIDLSGVKANTTIWVPAVVTYSIQSNTNPSDIQTYCGVTIRASVTLGVNGDALSMSFGFGPASEVTVPSGYRLINIGGPFSSKTFQFTLGGNSQGLTWTAQGDLYETVIYKFQAQ